MNMTRIDLLRTTWKITDCSCTEHQLTKKINLDSKSVCLRNCWKF